MKLHVLIDNLPNPANPALQHEHGLSILLQTDEGKNYLTDTGASGKFLENLEILRQADSTLPSAEEIDAVIISHGHNDHTGGLRSFLEANTTAKVYLHSSIQGNLYFSCRNRGASTTSPGIMEARSIGMEQSLFAEYGHRFIQISEPVSITDKITLVPMGDSIGKQPMPLGNKYLYKNDFPDNFSHEFALLIEYAPQEFAIISPCTHNGILNTLWSCTEAVGKKYPCNGTDDSLAAQHRNMLKCFIGGLHYVDYLKLEQGNKEAASIIETANTLKRDYPQLAIHSGHCTCAAASLLLEQELGDSYRCFRTGSIIECSTR